MSASSRQEPALWIDYLWLLLLGMIWGSSFNFIKIVVEEIPPASMALGRVLLASIFLYVIVKMAKLPLPKGRNKLDFNADGGFNGQCLSLYSNSMG